MRSLLDFLFRIRRRASRWRNRHRRFCGSVAMLPRLAFLPGEDLSTVAPWRCYAALPERARRDDRNFSRPHSRHARRYRGPGPYKTRATSDRAAGRADSGRVWHCLREAVNLCANNYLGLADHPDVIAAARAPWTRSASAWPRCASSAARRRCIASSNRRSPSISARTDAIVFAACFDANGGVFEPLLGEDDAIISDSLNHASIIDGVRLCKAKRYRFANSDMNELEDRRRRPTTPARGSSSSPATACSRWTATSPS